MGIVYRLGQGWEATKDLWSVLRPMRFCILVAIAIGYLIFAVDQSQDGLRALVEDALSLFKHDAGEQDGWAGTLDAIFFAVFAFGWGFQTFYWARFVSRIPPDPRPPPKYPRQVAKPPNNFYVLSDDAIKCLDLHLPRVLGGLVIVWVGLSVVKANWDRPPWVILAIVAVTVIALVLYFGLILWRRRVVRGILPTRNIAAFDVEGAFSYDLKAHSINEKVLRWGLVLIILTLVPFFVSGYWHVPDDWKGYIGFGLGVIWIAFGLWGAKKNGLPTPTKVMVGLNVIVTGAFFLLSIVQVVHPDAFDGLLKHLHFPTSPPIIMSVAAAWVFGGTFFLVYPGEVLRLPLTTFLAVFAIVVGLFGRYDNHMVRLRADQPAQITIDAAYDQWLDGQDKNAPKMVIVATAGGASRAAYWTALILSNIEQNIPNFHQHVFAISSVSGGSLGAGVYRAMLNDLPANVADRQPEAQCGKKPSFASLRDCGLAVIDHDFLGPTFLTGFYADLAQRVLPGALLPDRAGALEKSWEAAWAKTLPDAAVKLDNGFFSLWPAPAKNDWLPALLINGTSEKSGRRIITSNLQIDDKVFFDAVDFFGQMKHDVPVSTAIHNSARFPYIDAAGTLIVGDNGVTDRLIDGGYFENFGAGTAYDLAFYLRNRPNLQIFILQISSDPDLRNEATRDKAWPEAASWTLNVASDATVPPTGFYNTRDGVGYRATNVAGAFANRDGTPRYAFFTLTKDTEPMNWVLSDDAEATIRSEWDDPVNKQALQSVKDFLGAK